MKEVRRITGQQRRGMGLWLLIMGILFGAAAGFGKENTVNVAILGYGFVISFFLVFLNRKLMSRLVQGELDEVQHKIMDYSIAFLFLLMFFLISPFFSMIPAPFGWALVLALMGIHDLILSVVHGKIMFVLGGVVLLEALMLCIFRGLSIQIYLYVYAAILCGFGIFLLAKKCVRDGNEA